MLQISVANRGGEGERESKTTFCVRLSSCGLRTKKIYGSENHWIRSKEIFCLTHYLIFFIFHYTQLDV
jgi:hypothetical protein